MRGWMRAGTGPYERLPGVITSASWVDAYGDQVDSCTVTLDGVENWASLLRQQLRLYLSPVGPVGAVLPLYGPYEVDPRTISQEHQETALGGTVGSHFAATIADREDEGELFDQITSGIRRYFGGLNPYRDWLASSEAGITVGTIISLVEAELFNARHLAAVRQVLARWGLTVIPAPVLDGGIYDFLPVVRAKHAAYPAVQPGGAPFTLEAPPGPWQCAVADGLPVNIRPLLMPPAPSLAIRAPWEAIEALPRVTFPDGLNLPGMFRTRRIEGTQVFFNRDDNDVTLYRSGTLRPSVYLEPNIDVPRLALETHSVRWDLQNSAASLTLVRHLNADWDTLNRVPLVPQQLLEVPNDHLPTGVFGGGTSQWLIRSVNHNWNDSDGYYQVVQATLWQGAAVLVPAEIA